VAVGGGPRPPLPCPQDRPDREIQTIQRSSTPRGGPFLPRACLGMKLSLFQVPPKAGPSSRLATAVRPEMLRPITPRKPPKVQPPPPSIPPSTTVTSFPRRPLQAGLGPPLYEPRRPTSATTPPSLKHRPDAPNPRALDGGSFSAIKKTEGNTSLVTLARMMSEVRLKKTKAFVCRLWRPCPLNLPQPSIPLQQVRGRRRQVSRFSEGGAPLGAHRPPGLSFAQG